MHLYRLSSFDAGTFIVIPHSQRGEEIAHKMHKCVSNIVAVDIDVSHYANFLSLSFSPRLSFDCALFRIELLLRATDGIVCEAMQANGLRTRCDRRMEILFYWSQLTCLRCHPIQFYPSLMTRTFVFVSSYFADGPQTGRTVISAQNTINAVDFVL